MEVRQAKEQDLLRGGRREIACLFMHAHWPVEKSVTALLQQG